MIIKKGAGFDPSFMMEQPLDIIEFLEEESKKIIEAENEFKKMALKMGAMGSMMG